MVPRHDWQALHDALEVLENGLESPRIPGELELWLSNLDAAFQRVRPLIRQQVLTTHSQQLAQIHEEDPGLWARVENLHAKDMDSLQRTDEFQKQLTFLRGAARKLEPDEGRLEEQMTDFIAQGLAFIIHLRTQENALATWTSEALRRDRGTVD